MLLFGDLGTARSIFQSKCHVYGKNVKSVWKSKFLAAKHGKYMWYILSAMQACIIVYINQSRHDFVISLHQSTNPPSIRNGAIEKKKKSQERWV